MTKKDLAELMYPNVTMTIEDYEKKQKDNDAMADIIVKIRMNKDLMEVVDKVVSLDNAQINSLKHLLDTFI
mgnify:CR=1 FL=1